MYFTFFLKKVNRLSSLIIVPQVGDTVSEENKKFWLSRRRSEAELQNIYIVTRRSVFYKLQ